MKKLMKLTAILLMLLMTGALVAQDDYYDDAPAPRRSRSRGGLLRNKTLSVGITGSILLKTDILRDDDSVIESLEEESKKANIGLTARLYPFMDGKLGVGFSIIRLQTIEFTEGPNNWKLSEYLCDFDIRFRLKLGRKFLVNAGIGWSQYLTAWDDGIASGTEWGKLGFNLKIGGEIFLSRDISATIDWKWTHFEYDNFDNNITTDTITKRFLSVDIGLHYWL